jgi:ribonuclease BN (tRNA processing enzyme)
MSDPQRRFAGTAAIVVLSLFAGGLIASVGFTFATTESPVQVPTPPPEAQQAFEFEDDPEKLRDVVTGGVPMGRWKEGLLFEGIEPQPWLASAANWFPGTEEVQPDEIRVTFMGTAPMLRPGQMNTSIFVELGNGDSFVFDIGEGSVANYIAAGVPLNKVNNIFITHLHVDHFGSLPYVYAFGAWSGRWHEPLRVFGASGQGPDDGIAHMVEGMKMMMKWHIDAFSVFPVGRGWEVEVTEFPYQDDGGVIYNENGVEVIHWRRSHAKDGASGYRLNWNGMSFVWTGDGRPSELDAIYAQGADLYVTETQAELMSISSGVAGVPPFIGRYTIDTHHTPTYAAGLLCEQVQPRLCMTTHMQHDPYQDAEVIAEIREHWDGPYHPGAPDMVVVNMTKDQIWVRDGVIADYPNNKAPNADASIALYGGLVVPPPPYQRPDLQEQFIRDAELDPTSYYPDGYHPQLMQEWPTDKAIFVPDSLIPPSMKSAPRQDR